MRVLLIGAGGREHALAWKLAQSERLSKLYVAPGNGGTSQVDENVVLDPADHAAVVAWARANAIDFVVIGPDAVRDEGPNVVLDAIAASARVYVTLDVDVLDAALVPGVVSAEPDGLTYGEVRDILTVIAGHAEVVGADLVEVNPLVDTVSGGTAYIGTNLLIHFLGAVMAQPRWVERRQQQDS